MNLIVAALVMTGLAQQERPPQRGNKARSAAQRREEPRQQPATSKPMFSGPQVGERLPALKVRLLGEKEPKELVASHNGKPVQIIFFHKMARIAFAVIKPVTEFAVKYEKEKNFRTILVFLTDDPPAMEKQMKAVAGYLPKEVMVGVSPDGSNGPGNYGLNRNAMMTVLLGQGDKVTANFALGQPSQQVDGPRIAKAIVDLLKVPEPNYEAIKGGRNRGQRAVDRKLSRMVNPLLARNWTDEEAAEKIAEIEKYVGDNKGLKADLGTMIARIAPTGRSKMIPNAKVKAKFEEWKKLAPKKMRMDRRVQNDPMIRVLFQPFLARDAGEQAVKDAAARIVEYAKKHPAARDQIGGICRRIIAADRLGDWGTPAAQEFMKKWAKEFVTK